MDAKPGARLRANTHMAVYRALKNGTLNRPCHCERCGDTRVLAHHEDYSRPMDVMWLCPVHHKEEHEAELAMLAW